ncbi:hypothetical protein PN498_09305 [Oscillatoria sp. CS-180]|uniref:hypothetical protein n=1 Tax=Oscillatoria sp. CS-180 TaxID=3021720 RepID=UPI00232F0719|nr:hypothetical protein [Oscillatoria sp. CS-180]MDB9526181.1 hypothetical protein [Oscillatoria sp. CS-180]
MITVVPLETTQRLMQISQTRELDLPIPLSSGCAGYLSQEEMDIILQTLTGLAEQDVSAAGLVNDLHDYQARKNPVIPCH